MKSLLIFVLLASDILAQTKKSLPSAILYQNGVPSIACATANSYGAISVDFTNGVLYVCKSTGWVPVSAVTGDSGTVVVNTSDRKTDIDLAALMASNLTSTGQIDNSAASVTRPVRLVLVDQSGECSNNGEMVLRQSNSKLWNCQAGTWTQLNSGGISVTNAGANRIPVLNADGTILTGSTDGRTAVWTGYLLQVQGAIATSVLARDCSTTIGVGDNLSSYTRINLTGNCTLTSEMGASPTSGLQITVQICQDATGGRTLAWPATYTPAAYQVSGGTTIQTGLVTTANTCSSMNFIGDTNKGRFYATGLGVTGQ